jgi:hypothetical protein
MGRQYGVLLRLELKYSLEALDRMLAIISASKGVPLWIVKFYVNLKATTIAARLPKRFRDELQGISKGSGFTYRQILAVSMCYDIFRLRGCTGVISRNPTGELWHGHTTDIGWGLDWPQTIMVQHHPTGYHSFTSITWAGFLGTQTAFNDQGLCYSENTLTAKKINSRGFSVNYLARIIMEECGSLTETIPLFDKYKTINGEALYFSDLIHDQAAIAETTPLSPTCWAFVPMTDYLLYGVNLYQTPDFITKIQDNYQTQNGFNTGRLKILADTRARVFTPGQATTSQESKSSLDTLIEILRTSTGPDGRDYAKSAYQEGICNANTLQMVIFDPKGTGVYLSTGAYYASRNPIFYYPADFSIPPHLYQNKIPLDPVIEESAQILNSVGASGEEAWNLLTQKYPNDAFIWDYAGWSAFNFGILALWAEKMKRAYQLEPNLPEHKVIAASVAYYEHITRVNYNEQPEHSEQTLINLLYDMNPQELDSLNYQGLRLSLLQWAHQNTDPESAEIYANSLKQLYKENKPLRAWVTNYMKKLNPDDKK